MATDPITPAEIHAAELAALRDEVDQQRARAEAAEAELREAHKALHQLAEQFERMKEVANKAMKLLGVEGFK